MAKDKYDYKVLVTNFKQAHMYLYEWLKEYCDKEGLTTSQFIRDLIRQFKDAEENRESKGE